MGETRKPSIMAPGHRDDFQTPPEALAPTLKYLWRLSWDQPLTVWEPCAGEGNLVRALEEDGLNTLASDVLTGQDFLSWQPEEPWDALVTSPPFATKDAVLARAYELGKPFALLLPFAALEGRKRQSLFRKHGVEVVVLPKRPAFTTPSKKVGGSWFACAWFCYRLNIGSALTFAGEHEMRWPRQPAPLALELAL